MERTKASDIVLGLQREINWGHLDQMKSNQAVMQKLDNVTEELRAMKCSIEYLHDGVRTVQEKK
uniref:Uncharacterized protein n=1 Tax=Arundo donax TaxID=35708 RepID=A0A0A9GLD8_ARUDO